MTRRRLPVLVAAPLIFFALAAPSCQQRFCGDGGLPSSYVACPGGPAPITGMFCDPNAVACGSF